MKQKNVVYAIKNCDTDEILYIGSTTHFAARQKEHLSMLAQGRHHKALQDLYNEAGIEIISFDILEEVGDVNMLRQRERFYIDKIKPPGNTEDTRFTRRRERTRAALLSAARQGFAQAGFTATSIEDITRAEELLTPYLKEAIQEAQRSGKVGDEIDLPLTTGFIYGMISQETLWWTHHAEPSPDVMADQILRLLREGLPAALFVESTA